VSARREQICDSLRSRVASGLHLGLLQPGQRLGSARETARQLGTDYRIVVAAARQLERDGLLEVRPRAGIFVAGEAASPATAALSALGNRIVHWLLDEIASGMPAAGFADRVRRCLETVRLRAACVECNADQLHFLCRELATGYGLETSAHELERLGLEMPQLRHADLLVSTTHHAGEVRHLAARLGKPYVLVTLDPTQRAEVVRMLAERPVYVIGTDRRFAAKVRAIWSSEPGGANLRPLTVGEDTLDGVPAAAAVLVMPSARPLLADSPLLARALPPRGLSRESARQILSFVVQRNVEAEVRGTSGTRRDPLSPLA